MSEERCLNANNCKSPIFAGDLGVEEGGKEEGWGGGGGGVAMSHGIEPDKLFFKIS